MFLKRICVALTLLLSLVGCGNKAESPKSTAQTNASAEATRSKATSYLAYEHSLQLDASEERIPAIFELVRSQCDALAAESCAVLDSRIVSGNYPHAQIKIRAKPVAIQSIVASIGKEGEIAQRSTTAEDLAQPIADAAKQLEMLTDYRTRLESLRAKAVNDVDALIKVNKELATVQSELESATGRNAHLLRRVSTEVLSISIQPRNRGSFWRPISTAISEFGGNLAQGISFVVTSIAYLMPWFVVLFLAIYVWRKLKNRRSREKI
jgi:Domain of unknown function (DUF4349)